MLHQLQTFRRRQKVHASGARFRTRPVVDPSPSISALLLCVVDLRNVHAHPAGYQESRRRVALRWGRRGESSLPREWAKGNGRGSLPVPISPAGTPGLAAQHHESCTSLPSTTSLRTAVEHVQNDTDSSKSWSAVIGLPFLGSPTQQLLLRHGTIRNHL
jgi:hypothetical protein